MRYVRDMPLFALMINSWRDTSIYVSVMRSQGNNHEHKSKNKWVIYFCRSVAETIDGAASPNLDTYHPPPFTNCKTFFTEIQVYKAWNLKHFSHLVESDRTRLSSSAFHPSGFFADANKNSVFHCISWDQ